MIGLSELRAQGWKYACILALLGVVALLVMFLLARSDAAIADSRANHAEDRAVASEALAKSLSDALGRDSASATATEAARAAMAQSASDINQRFDALEKSIHGRPPVPAVCPDPDAGLVREGQAGTTRIRSAEDRLRNLRPARGENSARP